MSGPRNIIDSKQASSKGIDRSALYLRDGSLWAYVPAGCVLCAASIYSIDDATFVSEDDSKYECNKHGELERVEYSVNREYTVKIGEISRVGISQSIDFFLFPKNQTKDERKESLIKLINNAVEYEKKDPEESGD